jgi:hypothetical protein
MQWSREDVDALKMGVFWGDTVQEIAVYLSRDVAAVIEKAMELRLPLEGLGPASQSAHSNQPTSL